MSNSRSNRTWPVYYEAPALAKVGIGTCNLQADYLDCMPAAWLVVSIDLSDDCEELWVSRTSPREPPFMLRLPFKRENGGEDTDDALDFGEAKTEMINIIQHANESAHKTGDLSRKGAKTDWWKTRASLDTRLKDLLTNIENIWFGGFRGILCPRHSSGAVYDRFRRTFNSILSKHLPSRTSNSKSQVKDPGDLEDGVLQLFLAHSGPGTHEDIDDQLLDLLYFVIDMLQLHGERNAYDEVDFDAVRRS